MAGDRERWDLHAAKGGRPLHARRRALRHTCRDQRAAHSHTGESRGHPVSWHPGGQEAIQGREVQPHFRAEFSSLRVLRALSAATAGTGSQKTKDTLEFEGDDGGQQRFAGIRALTGVDRRRRAGGRAAA